MEPGRVEHLTKAEIGYLAGMVDFCGTFYISEEVKERRPTPQHDLPIAEDPEPRLECKDDRNGDADDSKHTRCHTSRGD